MYLLGIHQLVRPIWPPHAADAGCCCGPYMQEMLISCCTAGRQQVNVGSAVLSVYVVAEHRRVLVTELLEYLSSHRVLKHLIPLVHLHNEVIKETVLFHATVSLI